MRNKCDNCGKEYEVKKTATVSKYCSQTCRLEAKRKRLEIVRKCVVCGKEFKTENKLKILCGDPKCKSTRNKENIHRQKGAEKRVAYCELCKKDKTRLFSFCLDCYSIEVAGRPLLDHDVRLVINDKPFKMVM